MTINYFKISTGWRLKWTYVETMMKLSILSLDLIDIESQMFQVHLPFVLTNSGSVRRRKCVGSGPRTPSLSCLGRRRRRSRRSPSTRSASRRRSSPSSRYVLSTLHSANRIVKLKTLAQRRPLFNIDIFTSPAR